MKKEIKNLGEYKFKHKIITDLRKIPGIGKVIAHDLYDMKIKSVDELKRLRAERLYELHNKFRGFVQDKCMLYTFRCAIDYANKSEEGKKNFKLNWWDYKDK